MATPTYSWELTPLGEVLTERRETPSLLELASGAVRIVAKIGFNDGKIQVRADANTRTGMILVRPGDLVVSGINAAKGAIAIYEESNEGPVAATIHYGAYIPKKDRVDVRFLWWLLRSQVFKDILDTNLPGGIKTELKAKRLLPIKVPLPALVEQRRIVSRIEELYTKIEEARIQRQQSSGETEALVSAALATTFRERSNDVGWELKPLREAGEIARGKFGFRPRNDPRFYGGSIPFIQIGDISNSNRYIRRYSQTLNDTGLSISRMFPAGTVVIAITGATIGVTGILGFDSCFPDSIVGIVPRKESVISEFVFWALEYVKRGALEEATQTTQPNMNLKNLEKLRIPIPPLSDQENFVGHLDDMRARVDELQHLQFETAAELDALMPSILSKAFRGEL